MVHAASPNGSSTREPSGRNNDFASGGRGNNDAGLAPATALALLGIDRRIVGHSQSRYRKASRLRSQRELKKRVARRKERLRLEERYGKEEYIPSDARGGSPNPASSKF